MMPDIDDTKAPLMEHLIELRRRLLWSVVGLFICGAIGFYFSGEIFRLLLEPLRQAYASLGKPDPTIVYTKLYGAFFTELKIALFSGFFMAFPIIANQIWLFVAPGLYRSEKRAFLPFLVATPILFTMGAALAYFFVMPTAFRFFLSFEVPGGQSGVSQQALPEMSEYLSLVMQFIFAFGFSFLLPVLLVLLARVGIISLETLVKGRRYAIVIAFVVAAVVTPPDVLSQLMLAVPLMILYEASILCIRLINSQKAKAEIANQDVTVSD